MIRAIPGDPALVQAGPDSSPQQIAAIRESLGLNQPLPVQYILWLKNLLSGNLGNSFSTHSPVSQLLAAAIPPTLFLLIFSMVVGIVVGLLLGIAAVRFKDRWGGGVISALVSTIYGVPEFWLGLIAILFFGLLLHWIPVGGYISPSTSVSGWLSSLALPSIVLGLGLGAVLARFVRAALLDTISEDYIRTARAKGLSQPQTLTRHALQNALVPVVTVVGLQFGRLLGGAIVIETVFSIPGMGVLVITAVGQRDYTTLQATLLLMMLAFTVVNLLTDLSYHFIDPRLRH
jgi:peptide/nickel transport system permease protein